MKLQPRSVSLAQLYRFTIVFGVIGSVWVYAVWGWRAALAFSLGALVSLGNLWLFHRLSQSIEPGPQARKPWQASAFASRYLLYLAFGYVIVNALGVSPLPVVLGLFSSTAAVLLSSLLELAGSFTKRRDA